MKKILMPLPDRDFDPSESAIPWQYLNHHQVQVIFATPSGRMGQADPRMVEGTGLGIWKKLLMAKADAQACYAAMTQDQSFREPLPYDQIQGAEYDGIILPGGHAPGMKLYLESARLQSIIGEFFAANKPVGAICHGVLLAARSIDPQTGHSVLHGYQTTALLKTQELMAWWLTRWWLGDYYRTYPETVQDEVSACLIDKSNFRKGNAGLARDSATDTRGSFSILDRRYLSARWPGDAWHFAQEFLKLLESC